MISGGAARDQTRANSASTASRVRPASASRPIRWSSSAVEKVPCSVWLETMLSASWAPVMVGAWPTSVSTSATSPFSPAWYSSSVRP